MNGKDLVSMSEIERKQKRKQVKIIPNFFLVRSKSRALELNQTTGRAERDERNIWLFSVRCGVEWELGD